MILIRNSKPTKTGKKQFHVCYTGDNNEILATSENLESKQSCWVNIEAMAHLFNPLEYVFYVTDETPKKKQQYLWNVISNKKEKV